MARPKIDPAKRRSTQVKARFTPAETSMLSDKADKAGVSVTAFMRAAALGKRMTVIQSNAPDFETRDALRRIGINLNQIARAFNARQHVPPPILISTCEKLDALFDKWLDDDSTSS